MPCCAVTSTDPSIISRPEESSSTGTVFITLLALTIMGGITFGSIHLDLIHVGPLDQNFYLLTVVCGTPLVLSTIAFGCLFSLEKDNFEAIESLSTLATKDQSISLKPLTIDTAPTTHEPISFTATLPEITLLTYLDWGKEKGAITESAALTLKTSKSVFLKPKEDAPSSNLCHLVGGLFIGMGPDQKFTPYQFWDQIYSFAANIIMLELPKINYLPSTNTSLDKPSLNRSPVAIAITNEEYLLLPSSPEKVATIRDIRLSKDKTFDIVHVESLANVAGKYSRLAAFMLNFEREYTEQRWILQSKDEKNMCSCDLLALFYFIANVGLLSQSLEKNYTLDLEILINSFRQARPNFLKYDSPSEDDANNLIILISRWANECGFAIPADDSP